MAHPLLVQARRAIAFHLAGRAPSPSAEPGTPPQGCFVSLKLAGRLRGCIGTVLPVCRTLEAEVRANAVAAAIRDPRFPPLPSAELERVRLSIDLLTPPEPVDSVGALDAKRFGVLVRGGERLGVLLPDIPGIHSPQEQIDICLEKAGLQPDDPYQLQRFQVVRLVE